MQPRLPLVEPAGDILHEITRLRGRVLNLHKVLANNRDALSAFMVMSRHIRDDGSLAPKLRELAIVTIATTLENSYELSHHEPIARSLGLSDAQMHAVPDWTRSDLFTSLEAAIMRYAREITANRHASDDALLALLGLLSPAEAVDLALTVGWYHLCHVVIDSFGIELESNNV